MEDYLEAIAVLRGEEKVARVNGMSRRLGVTMPSVTSALKKLSDRGLVIHEKYGYVSLTDEGNKLAQDVLRRHRALARFFCEALGVDKRTGEEDACRIEHVISPVSMDRLTKFLEFMAACPFGETKFPETYRYFLEHGKLPQECLRRAPKYMGKGG